MEYNEIRYVGYPSRQWEQAVEQGFVTMHVNKHPVTGSTTAKMIRQTNANGELTTFTPRQAFLLG